MSGPRYSPLLSIQPWPSAGFSQDQWPPEKAVIRIHFFLLCALVHCLSSSVQCNQVNERACNEAIRCSLVLWAQHSILSSQTLAPSAGCALGWLGDGGGGGGMDTVCTQALIQDLAFHRLEDKLLSHVLHTRSAVSCGFRESSCFKRDPLVELQHCH